MKIVHLNTADQGGSYKAVNRIHRGLIQNGIDSVILLRTKFYPENEGEEVIGSASQKIISKIKNVLNLCKSKGAVISDYFGTDISKHPDVKSADAIFVHWCNSFISYKGLAKLVSLGKPVYVIGHDMWSATGGCHYDDYCERYTSGCGQCPMIGSSKNKDLSKKNFELKKKYYKDTIFVGPSKWSADVAMNSDIWAGHSINWIYNPMDYDVYKPLADSKRVEARKEYGLDERKIILYGANKALSNKTKGGQFVTEILSGLDTDKYQLVVFGNGDKQMIEGCPLNVKYLGYIDSEVEMAKIFGMVDVFLAPSKQESFCYTVAESLACGAPVVAYAVGGIAEQVKHKENGYLAKFGHTDDLRCGIEYCCDNSTKGFTLEKMDNTLVRTGEKYLDLINGK